MFDSCIQKQKKIIERFSLLKSPEDKYNKIIAMGKLQNKLDERFKTEANQVKGCQSRMYLKSFFKNGYVYFESESDALISAGLALLLIEVYSEEKPETILKCEPKFIQEIGLHESLSPSRSNGLASLHLKMKQEALLCLL